MVIIWVFAIFLVIVTFLVVGFYDRSVFSMIIGLQDGVVDFIIVQLLLIYFLLFPVSLQIR